MLEKFFYDSLKPADNLSAWMNTISEQTASFYLISKLREYSLILNVLQQLHALSRNAEYHIGVWFDDGAYQQFTIYLDNNHVFIHSTGDAGTKIKHCNINALENVCKEIILVNLTNWIDI